MKKRLSLLNRQKSSNPSSPWNLFTTLKRHWQNFLNGSPSFPVLPKFRLPGTAIRSKSVMMILFFTALFTMLLWYNPASLNSGSGRSLSTKGREEDNAAAADNNNNNGAVMSPEYLANFNVGPMKLTKVPCLFQNPIPNQPNLTFPFYIYSHTPPSPSSSSDQASPMGDDFLFDRVADKRMTFCKDTIIQLVQDCIRLHGPLCLVVDVGGNVGNCGLVAGLLGARVIVFEPDRELALLATFNMLQNGLSERVQVFPIGLWDQFESQPLFRMRGNSGHSRVNQTFHPAHKYLPRGIVHLAPLSHLLAERIHLLLVDVEGFELNVLQGALTLHSNFGIDAIHFKMLPALMPDPHEAIRTLRDVMRMDLYLGFDSEKKIPVKPLDDAGIKSKLKNVKTQAITDILAFKRDDDSPFADVFNEAEFEKFKAIDGVE